MAVERWAALLRADLPPGRWPDDEAGDGTTGFGPLPAGRARGALRIPFSAAGSCGAAGQARSRALLFDIGGGSTEIAWIRVGAAAPELAGYQSLPLGVLTLSELFGDRKFTASGFEAMVEHVTERLHAFETVHRIRREAARGTVRLLGTSGTVTTLAGVALGLRRYKRALVDGVVLSRQAAGDAIALLRGLGQAGLRRHPCVGPERAASVLPGCAIFEAIQRLWPTDGVVVADRGLRDGMLLRMMRDRSPATDDFLPASIAALGRVLPA